MRRFLIGLLSGLLAGVFLATASFGLAAQPIKLIVNGREVPCDPPPQMIGGRVFVPVRFVAEALGAKVEWDEANRAVVVCSSISGSLKGLGAKETEAASCKEVCVVADVVNVRSTPDSHAQNIICQVYEGETFKVLDRLMNKKYPEIVEWYEIELDNGQNCWIIAFSVEPITSPSAPE